MTVLLFDGDAARRGQLARMLRGGENGLMVREYGIAALYAPPAPCVGDSIAAIAVDGVLDLCAAERFARTRPGTPFFIVSGGEGFAPEAFRIGALHYLTWPPDEAALREALARCEGVPG